MAHRAVHVHQLGAQVQQERGLQHPAVLDVPAGEAVGVDLLERRLGDVVPVAQQQHRLRRPRAEAQVAQREIRPLVEELRVLVVSVEDHHVLHALGEQAPQQLARLRDEHVGVQADRAGQVVPPAGALLGLVSEGEGLEHLRPDPLGDRGRDRGGEQRIRAQRQVRAVLLEGAGGQDRDGAPAAHPLLVLPGGDGRQAHGAGGPVGRRACGRRRTGPSGACLHLPGRGGVGRRDIGGRGLCHR